jgi:2-polyprenyl-3-methyl-5-hydroxy-6-metoxy-1,4-benzoquinol methylase
MTETSKAWEAIQRMNATEGFSLGPINGESLLKDPKHLAFVLSRYKFAGKMLRRCGTILDAGCGEGLGALTFLAETAARITAIDFDEDQIRYCREQVEPRSEGRISFFRHDLVGGPVGTEPFDGFSCIDVIEHLHPQDEAVFLDNCASSLRAGGIAIWGTPNLHSSAYASPRSQIGHINLFDPERFTQTLERHYSQVFLFSMNDEVIHTGFSKMAHYLMALCVK